MKKYLYLIAALVLAFHLDVSAQFGGGPGRPQFPQIGITNVDPVNIDEVITIENPTRLPMDFTGWRLQLTRPNSLAAISYEFPSGCVLPPGGILRVHSGPGNVGVKSTQCGEAEADLVWSTSFILPNDKFTLQLINADGETVSEFDYPEPILPPVFVNEMEMTPASGHEWIELYNASNVPVDLTDWTIEILRGTSVKLSIPIDQVIPAGGFLVISVGIPFLSDNGEIIELRDHQGRLVDTTPETGLPDGLADERCWARAQDGVNAWTFQTCTRESTNAL